MSNVISESLSKVKNKQKEVVSVEQELFDTMKEQIVVIVKEKAKEIAETITDSDVLKFKVNFEQSGYDIEPVLSYQIATKKEPEFFRFYSFGIDVEKIGKSNIKFGNELKKSIKPIMDDEDLVSILLRYSDCNSITIDLTNI